MYGLVLKALADVARAGAGEQAWREICVRAQVDEQFVGTRAYPEDLTGRLVAEVAGELGLSTDQVLHRLGRHWIRCTADEGWGPLLQVLGPDLVGALEHLDDLHVRVGLLLPHLRPPSFRVTDVTTGGLLLHYRSERVGLDAMVRGLVEELGERYATPVDVRRAGRRDGAAVFDVRFRGDR